MKKGIASILFGAMVMMIITSISHNADIVVNMTGGCASLFMWCFLDVLKPS
jgi:hypothetical protein